MANSPDSTTATVHVAVGIIENEAGDIFISRRHAHLHQGGKWEFPGGKVEANETVMAALQRELREECNIEVEAAAPLTVVSHAYPDKQVLLDVWRVTAYRGEVRQREGQEWLWVPLHELEAYPFPAANEPILSALHHR